MKNKSLTDTVNFLKKQNADRNMKFNRDGERIDAKSDNLQSGIFPSQIDTPFEQMKVIKFGEPVVVHRGEVDEAQSRQRSSNNIAIKDAKLRKAVINNIIAKLLFSEITQGDALIQLRIQVLGFNQEKYAKLVNVSRKKISDIENNRSNPSVEVLNKIFKPFGLNVGMIPISSTVLRNVLDGDSFTR